MPTPIPIPFKLFGLQRTGTNLMQLLMTRNFLATSVESGTEWKHGHVQDAARIWQGQPVHFIWCVKNPYAWLVSCYRYFQRSWNMDKTVAPQFRENPNQSFPEFVRTATYEFQSPVHRWNAMNRHWLTQLPAERTALIRQEELVEHQLEVLERLKAAWDLMPRTEQLITTLRHVDCNLRMGQPISRSYYWEQRYLRDFPEESLEFVNRHLEEELMTHFGYPVESAASSPKTDAPAQEAVVHLTSDDPLTEHNALARLNQVVAQLVERVDQASNGRGIVICGGGSRYFPCAWVCIHMLRHLGCTLPIELWHLGPAEMNATLRPLIEPLGVTCVDALEVRKTHPCRILNGWELKPYSIIYSRFDDVLFLDADNVPVVDPTFLFDAPEYQRAGAIFWPDYGRLDRQRSVWKLTGIPFRTEPEFESGQIVVDKRRCSKPLVLTLWFNQHSDFWYRHFHGDKETFHLAWRKLNAPYAMPSTPIFPLSWTMCQHDFAGRRIFQHRNLAKWQFRGNPAIEGFLFEAECLKFLEALLPHWKQTAPIGVYQAIEKSPEEMAQAEQLCQTQWIYDRVGYDKRPMRFCADGTIGQGSAGCEVFWELRQINGEFCLEIMSHDDLTCRLKARDGVWRGRWEHFEKMPIELRPRNP